MDPFPMTYAFPVVTGKGPTYLDSGMDTYCTVPHKESILFLNLFKIK